MGKVGPVVLGPNQPPRFYRGGARIAAFRSLAAGGESDHLPEDWVGSVTGVFGAPQLGLTRLPDGTLLRDAINDDPVAYLGSPHLARHGSSPALLVKLLDAAQRLPVHCHPGDDFACRHLASPYGKTEAWIVIDAAPGSVVYLGFSEAVTDETLARWVTAQDPVIARMLNQVPVERGDAILVPAGTPHAIGAGVFIVELQQPTDLSLLLEWDSFPIDGATEGHLGLGFGLALNCVDRSVWDAGRIASLRGPCRAGQARPVETILPAGADSYFTAQRVRPDLGPVTLDPCFAILVVTAGAGMLRAEHGTQIPLGAGMTVLVPYAAGQSEIHGNSEVIRCIPPNATAAGSDA